MPPRLVVARKPFALPPVPDVPFAVVDVAFAGGNATQHTLDFIASAGDRLKLWVDHHEHGRAWPFFQGDPRFVLVPSRQAHACPELVTPEVVARCGEVGAIVAHHDFDGLMSAAKFLLGGKEPYEGADEDARAADAPGRGHVLSPRAERLVFALGEAGSELEDSDFEALATRFVDAVIAGNEPPDLKQQLDDFYAEAKHVQARADTLAEGSKEEVPGVRVLRVDTQLDGRMRRAVLNVLESRAMIGLVLEGTPKRYWATAATYDDRIELEAAKDLDRGRHDFRFGPTKNADVLLQTLARLVRDVDR